LNIDFENPLSIDTNPLENTFIYLNKDLLLDLDSLSIHLVSDEALLKINIEYLNHDYYTDIITFDLRDETSSDAEIFISIDRVKENADTNELPFEQELLRVAIHGMLHLSGINDKTGSEKAEMRKLEEKYLQKLFHVKRI